MAVYHWTTAPEAVREQANRLISGLQAVLGEALVGLYLHGSLAMGCFNPARSDVDLLAVVREPLEPATRRQVAELLLALSGAPHPLEISLLARSDLAPWRFPVPYDFHFSEGWRERLRARLTGGRAAEWARPEDGDPDLAAHITVLHERGVVLVGPPAGQLFPPVPPRDYLTAIWDHDTRGAAERIAADPVYGVLNLCRVLCYVQEGKVASKAEGGRWALAALPLHLRPVVRRALAAYAGDETAVSWEEGELTQLACWVSREIDRRIHPG